MIPFDATRCAALSLISAALCVMAGCGGSSTAIAGPATPTSRNTQIAAAVLQGQVVLNDNFADGLSRWTTEKVDLAGSPMRSGGYSMTVGQRATQSLPAGRLVAGTAYALVVVARVESTAHPARVAVNFRRPQGSEIFRTYQTAVTSTAFRAYRLEFTAPAFASMAEVSVLAEGAPVVVDAVSLAERTPIGQTEPVTTTQGSYVPAGYALDFNDEFNAGELNRSKWFTRYIHAGGTLDRLNDEKQRYRDNDNHRVANGVLSLTARKVSDGDPAGVNYESGMIRSDWTARYGYFEARVRMPGGRGVWPAFWLASDVASNGALAWPPEIDIFEFVNNGVEDTVDMLHGNVINPPQVASTLSYADPMFDKTWSYYRAPFHFDAGWHTVGCEWDATSVTMYVDGRKVYTRGYLWNFPDGSPAGPAHILLNLAIGGQWAGRHGIDDAAFPQSLQIDWVRAYRRAW